MKKTLTFLMLCITLLKGNAQFYQAVHGSNFAGSLGILNNPASGLTSPNPWDVTLFGLQTRNLMNLLYAEKYGPGGAKDKLSVFLKNGEFKRVLNNNTNINIINTRIRLKNRLSVGFGINLRSLSNLGTSKFSLQDSFPNIDSFFVANFSNQPMSANLTSSSWSETFVNFSYNVVENKRFFWNVGVSFKFTQGLAGFHTKLDNAQFKRVIPAFPFHNLTDVDLLYFYSRNIDVWSTGESALIKLRNHIQKSEAGAIVDLGMEWVVKDKSNIALFENVPQYNYTWKIGLSLLDLGYAQYKNGLYSMNATGMSPNINAVSLNRKFKGVANTFNSFHDSLRTLVQSFTPFAGKLKFAPPARLVINVDRIINDMFAVNADFNLPVNLLPSGRFYNLKMVPSLSITPRIENKRFGAYVPITMNTEGNFWLGMALRSGAFLFGLHDLKPFLKKSPYLNGGGYISFILSPSDRIKKIKPQDVKCPD